MRSVYVSIAILATSLDARLNAQSPNDSLTLRRLAGNITFLLPASWAPLSDTTRVRISSAMDTVFEHSRDTLVQASLRNGKPVVLLHETAPGQSDPSASFNAAPVVNESGGRPHTRCSRIPFVNTSAWRRSLSAIR